MAEDSEWLAALLRCMPGAALVLDAEEVRAVNNDLPELFDIPRARITGAPLGDLVIPEHQAPLQEFLGGLNGSSSIDLRLAANYRPVQLRARRISDRLVVATARSMDLEFQLSADARGAMTHDAVTGLANRYVVLEELHRRLHRGPTHPMAIIALWVDDLDRVRHDSGDRVGDLILRQVAERLSTRLRGSDLLGRLGPDTFITLLVSDSTGDELGAVAERLRNEVSFPVEYDATLVSFTSTVLVHSVGKRPPGVERIIAQLEQTGGQAVAQGGNRTVIV